jgi:DNA-directed RNA polymerase subunit RPC12/RpoP
MPAMLDFAVMTRESDKRRHSCPNCGSESVRRSLRSGFIENIIYRLIGLRPYRCMACETRFIDRRSAEARRDSSDE